MTSIIKTPDFATFTSRLLLCGQLKFDTAMRIGASRSNKVDEPDLPVLRDAFGQPYIPGSSMKGALRSYVESLLRTIQSQPGITDCNLSCIPVGKPERRNSSQNGQPLEGACLTLDEVRALKNVAPQDWHVPQAMPNALQKRLPGAQEIENYLREGGSEEQLVDDVLRALSCYACRIFGAQWLASKVLIRDLYLQDDWIIPREIRDGVAIDRDSGRAANAQKYRFEALPPGTVFESAILVENAAPEELGALFLGIRAFENGEILMGGARSRGLGWCSLSINWAESRFTSAATILDDVFGERRAEDSLQARSRQWVEAFRSAIGLQKAVGGEHA